MLSEVNKGNTSMDYITQNDFCMIMDIAKSQSGGDEENATIEAFVAMGGSQKIDNYGEKEAVGTVKAKNLIESIRDECEMTIDIERLLLEMEDDDDIGKNRSGKH